MEEIYEEMKDIAKRVLKGECDVNNQEIAILPDILKMLADYYQDKH